MKRIYSIDFARGIVMIIMALDHVRDLIHRDSITQSPVNLETTTPILFFTRWITYLCAPAFVFLAGTSAFISLRNQNDPGQSRRFLLTRGIWLIVLEFAIVNFGMYFDLGLHTFIFEVIATIGFGFILLSFLSRLPLKVIGIIGLCIIALHDLFSLLKLGPGTLNGIITSLFSVNAFPLSADRVLVIAYPPFPWLGIMLVGYACGSYFLRTQERRAKLFTGIALGALALFVILRFINVYGNPFKWASQKSGVYTFLSFMNVTKYPPSLQFTLVTLGFMFLILLWGEKSSNRFTKIAAVYGKVPLFYFIVHFYLIHLLLLLILRLQGFHFSDMDFASGNFGRPKGVESGLPLWAVYLIWAGLVIGLYAPCKWYGKLKASRRYGWLRYL